MIPVRVFTEYGIEKFSQYINSLDNPTELVLPDLNQEPYSVFFRPRDDIEIDENKKFTNRLDMGKYITKVFNGAGIERSEIIDNSGLWSWFAYMWFKQLCKKDKGVYQIYEIPRYICSSSWGRYYRHFIALPYFLVSLHGEEFTRIFLNMLPYEHTDLTEQLVSSQNIISSPTIVKVIHILYWDNRLSKAKKGASLKNKTDPGTARRFRIFYNQLRLTYDLNRMKENDILELLPHEFDKFKNIK
jgi:hypothetical protein